ncbi:MAG: thioesterase family protein [Chloroflexota bacterium]|nr:thioesterase family protein [Chloroflexota bacterium]MDE2961137.1 thioesterase family protein [Chloroflexota bacterium]
MTQLRSDYRFGVDVRVRWQECDAQGIAFNGSYLGWLEIAQAEYFRNLGFSIYRVAAAGYFDSTVAKVTIEYQAPVRVDEMLDLRARVARIGNTSLVLEVAIFAGDGGGGPDDAPLTTIEAIYVGFHADTGQTRRVPDSIRNLVDRWEAAGEVLSLERFPELAAAQG